MLTRKQVAKYWRTWGAICAVQGWRNSDNDRRYALHAEAGCPQSMKDFTNSDFDLFLEATAPLMEIVDIRDRGRQRVEFVIKRLSEAIDAITGGDNYRHTLLVDMHDTIRTDNLPLDPIEQQQEEGRVHHFKRTHAGTKAVYSGDLDNHKRLLKNRLSKLLTRAKAGEIQMPDGILRDGWQDIANNTLIDGLIGRKQPLRLPVGTAGPSRPHATPRALVGAETDPF